MHIPIVLDLAEAVLGIESKLGLLSPASINPYPLGILPTQLSIDLFFWRGKINAHTVAKHHGHHM